VSTLFWGTYVVLWLLVVMLFAAVFFLYHHHGRMLLNSREGRANQGPAVNQPLPVAQLRDIAGEAVALGQPQTRSRLIFLASTTCQPCQAARAALSAFAEKYRETIETVMVCAGSEQEVREFAADLAGSVRVIVDSPKKFAAQLRVTSTPFALIIDPDGIVRGRGMPVTMEAFETMSEQTEIISARQGREFDAIHVSSVRI